VIAPRRALDTRNTTQKVLGTSGVRDVAVTGVAGVPIGASAVVLNVTGVDASRLTDLRVYPTPADSSFPVVSNLNLLGRQTAANLVMTRVGTTDTSGRGRVRIRNAAGEVAVVADITGWFAP
jgi:hypothetical protein